MARKRQRHDNGSYSPIKVFVGDEYDTKKFVSREASIFYELSLAHSKGIPERGFYPDKHVDSDVFALIKANKWEALIEQPGAPVLDLVREFYANAIEVEANIVQVRGKLVWFSPSIINSYFRLPNLTGEEYEKYRVGGNQWHKALQCLNRLGAVWDTNMSNELYISTTELSRYVLTWFYFICACLLPSTKLTELNRDQASLLYAIVKGKKIDVGLIIYDSIRHAMNGDFMNGMLHPSLIHGLCLEAGVCIGFDEERQSPQAPIMTELMRNFRIWTGADSHPTGVGFITKQRLGRKLSTSATLIDQLLTKVSELEKFCLVARRQLRRVDKLIHKMDKQLDQTKEINFVLTQLLEEGRFNDVMHSPPLSRQSIQNDPEVKEVSSNPQ